MVGAEKSIVVFGMRDTSVLSLHGGSYYVVIGTNEVRQMSTETDSLVRTSSNWIFLSVCT